MDPVLLLKGTEFVRDAVKDVLSLSAGILTISITFGTNLLAKSSKRALKVLVLAWVVQLGSIIAGVMALLSISGNVATAAGGGEADLAAGMVVTHEADAGAPENASKLAIPKRANRQERRTVSPYESNVRLTSYGQMILFLTGTGLLVVVGAAAFGNPEECKPAKRSVPFPAAWRRIRGASNAGRRR